MPAVEGTPFDLRTPTVVGTGIQGTPSKGFDHNFCLGSDIPTQGITGSLHECGR